MLSMTGYGYAITRTRKYGNFEIEVVSLNSKNLEITISGNREVLGLEKEIREVIRKYLRKGKVKIKYYFPPPEDYEINDKKLKKLIDRIKKFSKSSKINIYLENADVIKEIFIKKENLKEKREIFLKTLEKAIKNLLAFRKREGENLKRGIIKEIKKLKNLIAQIDEEKCIEEKIRLFSHLKSIQKIINRKKEATGKELDFLGQEILREGNTVSQKTESLKGIEIALKIKVCAETIREISRNIE